MHTPAFVKHKAVSGVVVAAHILEVFQDAAVELVDLFHTQFTQVDGSFLTPYATGAVTDHGLVLEFMQVGLGGVGKFTELGESPIDGPLERACVHLEIVARIQRDHGAAVVVVSLVQPAFQRGCRHRRGAAMLRLDGGVVHADDLVLHLHQQFFERL